MGGVRELDKAVKLWDGHNGMFVATMRHADCASIAWPVILDGGQLQQGLHAEGVVRSNQEAGVPPGHADEVFAVDCRPWGQRRRAGKDKMLG